MSAPEWMFVCLLTCFLSCSVSQASGIWNNVRSGDDVILQCHGPKDVAMLEWIKPDMEDKHVFFFREKKSHEDYQHPGFRGRVELADPEMKDGNFSVILKNVNSDDSGPYECHVGKGHSRRRKRETPKLINSFTVEVDSDWRGIEAHTGDQITLPCQALSNTPITTVRWTMRNKRGYVFLYHDGRSVPDNQHPYYKNWVEMKDSEMKDGDASLILKDVKNINSGTYECRINQGGTYERINVTSLYVYPPVSPLVPINITADTGDPVTLPCRALSNTSVTAVEWRRTDKKDYVFLYSDGRSVSDNQHPLYKNWVELKDSEMKDGAASLILKDVMNINSGTYECWINQGGINHRTSVINLYVYSPDPHQNNRDNN